MTPNDPWDRPVGARVPFAWRWFFKKYATLLRDGEPPRRVLGEAALRLGLLGAVQAGWALDEVLARGWRRAPFRGPLFILGHQRSGTTFLHRLLATDSRLLAQPLHAQLLPPVTVQGALGALERVDGRLGRPLGRRFDALEARLFGPLDDLHRLRLAAVEEDEFVLWGLFASGLAANDTPRACASAALDGLRDFATWPERARADALGYYRAVLQKAAHRRARPGVAPPWLLAKNPAFTAKVDALERVFPDARFIFVHRDPLAAIASRLSLVRAIWRRRVPGFGELTPAQVERFVRDSLRTYHAAAHYAPRLAYDRSIMVTYDALQHDPAGQIRRVLARFGLGAPDPQLAAALAALTARTERHASGHRYALEDFGLNAADILARLGPAAQPPREPAGP